MLSKLANFHYIHWAVEKKWHLIEFLVVRKKHDWYVYFKENVQKKPLKMNSTNNNANGSGTMNVYSHHILSFNTIYEKVDIPQNLNI